MDSMEFEGVQHKGSEVDAPRHPPGRHGLTREEIRMLAEELARLQPHHCRMPTVDAIKLDAAIRFYQHVDQLLTETGSTVRKTVIVVGISGLLSLLVLGIYAKIKEAIGQ